MPSHKSNTMNKYLFEGKECYSTGLTKDSTISGLVEVEFRNENEIGFYNKKYFTKNFIKQK